MRILLICAENYSLGDSSFAKAVGSMTSAYRKLGAEVLGFSPFFSKLEKEADYSEVKKSTEKLSNLEYSALKHKDDKKGENILIRFEDYFGREGIYGDTREKSYADNHLRFSFLASAAMNYCVESKFKPDAIHVHEWSGIAGALAKTVYKEHFAGIPVILTIHNIRYDFHCSPQDIMRVGFPVEDFNADGYEFWGKVSLLKAAILYSDKVVFTSRSYLLYLLASDLPGGMRGFLESHSNKLTSIQSGIDYDTWSIPEQYEEFKKKKKDEFRSELGLEANSSMLIYSHINKDSNTSAQVISTILANLLHMNLQLVIGISEENSNYQYFATIQEKNRSKLLLLPHTNEDESLFYRLAASDSYFFVSAEDPSLESFLKSAATGCMSVSSRRNKEFALTIKAFCNSGKEDKSEANAFVADSVSPDLVLEQIRLAESVFCQDKNLWGKITANAKSIKMPWDETAKNYFSTFALNS